MANRGRAQFHSVLTKLERLGSDTHINLKLKARGKNQHVNNSHIPEIGRKVCGESMGRARTALDPALCARGFWPARHPGSKALNPSAYCREFADSAQWLRTWSLEATALGADTGPAVAAPCCGSDAAALLLGWGGRTAPGRVCVRVRGSRGPEPALVGAPSSSRERGNPERSFHQGLERTASWEMRCRSL